VGLLVAVALAGVALFAAVDSMGGSAASFTATDFPDPVTAGLAVSQTFNATNTGLDTMVTAGVVDRLPAGAVFVSASTTRGKCAQSAGKVTCDFGKMTRGDSASVTILFKAPPASFQNCAVFSFTTRVGDLPTSRPQSLNACTSTSVRPANDPNFRSGCIGATQSIATGTNATATDRQNTALQTPTAACVTVQEVPAKSATDACGAGFTCKTEVSEIEHPPCRGATPCQITITFDKSFGTITKLFYNGVLVKPCTKPGVASPDPCLVSRTLIPSRGLLTFDTKFTILSAIDARLRGG
jgi:uncharacterized repeat protein (TIGR01451 family)